MNLNPLVTLAKKDRHVTVTQKTCICCGSKVSTYNANAKVIALRPTANNSDWWAACDNADCVNAEGEGYFQEQPDWIKV
jgi:hypothetical protein